MDNLPTPLIAAAVFALLFSASQHHALVDERGAL
jgi:hypothetical protein